MVANVNSAYLGEITKLGLTDPDSNEVVPFDAPGLLETSCSPVKAT